MYIFGPNCRGGLNLQILGKRNKFMTQKKPLILRNLDDFPPATFRSTPLQLGTKE